MPVLRLASLAFLALFLAGCGRYFPPDINLDRYVTPADMVGTWTLLPASLVVAERDGYAPAADAIHEIELRADGTCSMRSITASGLTGTYTRGEGNWRLAHDTGSGNEKKRKNEIAIFIDRRGFRFSLTEEDGRLLLWEFWGYPDSWEFLKYARRG